MIDETKLNILKEFYIPLKLSLTDLKKFKGSCLPALIKSGANKLKEVFLKSSRLKSNFIKEDIDSLIDGNYLMEFENSGKYILSAKGIWYYETNRLFSEDEVFEEITNNFIKKTYVGDKKMKDREKWILFTLFSMRCFSRSTSIELLKHKRLIIWLEVFKKTQKFLEGNKVIGKVSLPKEKGIKHPVATLVASASPELKKSFPIYIGLGNGIFYLDLLDREGILDREGNKVLFEKIFGKASLQFKKEILDFCSEILNEYVIKVFDNSEFRGLKMDKELKEKIMSL